MSEHADLRVARDGAVVSLTLDRPDKLNAIDLPLATRLDDALAAAEADSGVRAIVLAGTGRAFCAGRDVGAPPDAAILERVQAVAVRLATGRVPVVAALHGWVVGAGLEWALACELAVASRTARFRLPEVGLGVFVTGGATALLPRVAGLSRARRILLLGEPFEAIDAERWGLVATLAEDDGAARAEALRQAMRLAAFDPTVLDGLRAALRRFGADGFAEAVALETREQTAIDARRDAG